MNSGINEQNDTKAVYSLEFSLKLEYNNADKRQQRLTEKTTYHRRYNMEIFAGILPGMLEMPNIHPIFVHFPIALLCGFLLMEALGAIMDKCSMRGAASWMLYLGTLGAIVTVTSGFFAEGSVEHGAAVHDLIECHALLGIIILILSLILSIWRISVGGRFSAGWRTVHFIIGAVMVIAVCLAADKGATMVYKHSVGVTATLAIDTAPMPEAGTGHAH